MIPLGTEGTSELNGTYAVEEAPALPEAVPPVPPPVRFAPLGCKAKTTVSAPLRENQSEKWHDNAKKKRRRQGWRKERRAHPDRS